MEVNSGQISSFEPHMGILIPSPIISHTHAITPHPFDPNALLTVKHGLKYLPEHALANFPLHQQVILYAGQSIVVQEMAKVKQCESEIRRIQNLPEIELKIHENFKVKPMADSEYWRKLLGWAGSSCTNAREQSYRYITFMPVKSRLFIGVKDKYIWDHKLGHWKRITMAAAVQQATERRLWVCKELERIDALRYKIEAEWVKSVQELYMAGVDRKRKREDERSAHTGAREVEDDPSTKSKTVNFDDGVLPTTESASKKPRLTFEAPVKLLPSEMPFRQNTALSFSDMFSVSPDTEHEVRSQAPEPESPIKQGGLFKETTADFLRRYSFVLDIPVADGQRVAWINFLDKYQWNKSMISSLRKFFVTDIPPTMCQTAVFLKKLKEVCASIEEIGGDGPHNEYRLLWDAKTTVHVHKTVAKANVEAETFLPPGQTQPAWLSPIRPQPTSPPTKDRDHVKGSGRATPNPSTRSPIATFPTSSQVRRAFIAENVQSAMRKHVRTLKKGARVEPPCDRCRGLGLKCLINFTSCQGCADAHDRCSWSQVLVEEVRELGILNAEQGQGLELELGTPARVGLRGGKKYHPGGRPGKRKAKKHGKGEAVKKRKSFYELPEDGDETRAFLEDGENDSREDGDGDETKAFLNGDDGEEEYVPVF